MDITELSECLKLLENIHYVLFKLHGSTFHWPYFHRLVFESINECVAHIQANDGQEQVIEHILKIQANIFARHNNNRDEYYMNMFKYYWIIVFFAVIVEIVDFKRSASKLLRIELWTLEDQENYDLDNVNDEKML